MTAQQEAIPGAQVTLRAPDSTAELRATSNSGGMFRFPAVAPGEYLLAVESSGYLTAEQRLEVKPRQPLALTVELAARPQTSTEIEVKTAPPEVDAQASTSRFLTHQELERMPAPQTRDVQALAESVAPGAVLSHDNFVHVRGNELSLHEFINGVSFLDNAHQHFTPGLSPQIFEAVNVMTGGFPAEFGNRFGGILDITTRSGRSLRGHGSASLRGGTVANHDGAVEYGGGTERWGYYFFGGAFSSDRFLNPPEAIERHDFGYGVRGAAQVDYQGSKDLVRLLITGGHTDFELPNTTEQEELGRDASRRLGSQTAILTWQRVFSPRALLSVAGYQRIISEQLAPTTDEHTTFADGSRSTLSAGFKTDVSYARGGHVFKAGVDVLRLRLLESLVFDPRVEEHDHGHDLRAFLDSPGAGPKFHSVDADEAFSFREGAHGGQVSLYAQDHFSPFRNFTVDVGVRWDQFDLNGAQVALSPRFGAAYHLERTGTVLHFAYNRFFTPPPIEFLLLANTLGTHAEPSQRVGAVRAYRQDYYEAGLRQRLHPKLSLEINAYTHSGRNSYENSEISDTRLFVPTNFARAKAWGTEVALVLDQLSRLGLSGRLQYAAARVEFIGPIAGGFAGHEVLEPGERILPAFDQRHTATASLFYRNRWRNFWTGMNLRYGSGTPTEEEIEVNGQPEHLVVRLPQHFTADLAAGATLLQRESQRVDLEFNLLNISDNRYRIAKESEVTPVQFAPRRVISGGLKWRF
jgi:outer membrane receptor protein involved in Fe transport